MAVAGVEKYYSGQGKVFFRDLDSNGNMVGPWKWVGNVPELTFTMNTEFLEKTESYSGKRSTVRRITTSQSASISLTLDQFDADNLSLALNGVEITKAAGSPVTDLPLGNATDFSAGDSIDLGEQYFNVTNLVVKAGSTELVLNEQYEVDLKSGMITFRDMTGVTGAITADFTPGAYKIANVLTKNAVEKAFRFEGLNTAEVDANGDPDRIILMFYKVQLATNGDISMISDDFGSFPLTGEALRDSSRPESSDLGQFGAVIVIDGSETAA